MVNSFTDSTINNPFSAIEEWSKTRNSKEFVIKVNKSTRLGKCIIALSPHEIVYNTVQAANFIEYFQHDWGVKALPAIRKIKARMYHAECHAPQDRRQEVQNAIHRMSVIIKNIEDFSSVKPDEFFPPCLLPEIVTLIVQYSGGLKSIRDHATLASQKVIHVTEIKFSKFNISAAFHTVTDNAVAFSMLEFISKKQSLAKNVIFKKLLKSTPESREIVDKFKENQYKKYFPPICLPENFPSADLTKFRDITSLQKAGGFDPNEVNILMQMPNLTCFINDDVNGKLHEKSYKAIIRNRNLQFLELINGKRLNERAFLGAKNPNLLALFLSQCPQLTLGVLPQLGKSFPCLRILHIQLGRTTKKELQNLDALSKFPSLEYLFFECDQTFTHFKALNEKLDALKLTNLKDLVVPTSNAQLAEPVLDMQSSTIKSSLNETKKAYRHAKVDLIESIYRVAALRMEPEESKEEEKI